MTGKDTESPYETGESLVNAGGGGEDPTPRSESATAAIQVRFDCILFENLGWTLEEGEAENPITYSMNLGSFVDTPRG